MEIKDIIKTLRLREGLTQEELATKVGLKKAAINKYESGLVTNIKQPIIANLAKALNCTPSFLMGWEDQPNINIISNNLSISEEQHITKYRSLTETSKETVDNLIDNLLKVEKPIAMLVAYGGNNEELPAPTEEQLIKAREILNRNK